MTNKKISEFENVGFENVFGKVALLWKCVRCGYEQPGGLIPPSSCPICKRIDACKPVYAIAYTDIDGEDFAENEPFIFDIGDERLAKYYSKEMLNEGYQKAVVFSYDGSKDEEAEKITWDFVKTHAV